MSYQPRDIHKRFWSKVHRAGPDQCWNWQASRLPDLGYGQFSCTRSIAGIEGRGRTMTRAHRLAWILTYGAIDDGLFVLHKCDNPACCNPAHLFLGTQTDNMQDCVEKGRHGHGTVGHTRKHSGESIQAAIDDYVATHDPVSEVCLRHGIAESHLRRLIKKQGHVIVQQYGKLNPSQTEEIRALYATGDYTYFDLAARFGVTFSMIGYVVNRRGAI